MNGLSLFVIYNAGQFLKCTYPSFINTIYNSMQNWKVFPELLRHNQLFFFFLTARKHLFCCPNRDIHWLESVFKHTLQAKSSTVDQHSAFYIKRATINFFSFSPFTTAVLCAHESYYASIWILCTRDWSKKVNDQLWAKAFKTLRLMRYMNSRFATWLL